MTTLRAYKFLIVPVLQEVDDDGDVIQEITAKDPMTIFGLDRLKEYAENFEELVLANVQPVQESNGQVR